MKAKARLALIGCGRIGQVHLRSLLAMRDTCELVTIADAYEPAVRASAEQFGLDSWTTDVDSIMADPSVDAVIIASSTDTHGPFISAAARSGKDAFTEKPIALDLESTDRALADVRAAGTRLQIGFQRRFDSGYRSTKERIDRGELGTVEFIRDAMRDPEPPPFSYAQKSGGLFRDMTIHNFDCVRWLMGSDPIDVFATGSVLVSPEIASIPDIDTSVITMRFASGALATIENSRRSGFGYDVRTEVFGSKGAVMIGESRATPVRVFANGVHEDHQYFFLDRFGDAFRAEIASFIDAIRNDTPVAVSGEDGRAALLLAYAAAASLQANTRVKLADLATDERIAVHATS
jgi:myo-inositol 2-dehydrogenase/D-chiro-inositol 1-dehydrogenase